MEKGSNIANYSASERKRGKIITGKIYAFGESECMGVFYIFLSTVFCSFQSVISSVAQSCPTLCDPMNFSTPGLPVHHQLLGSTQTMSIESVMPSNHLILCHPLLLLPSVFPNIRVFSNESTRRMRWPKYWSFNFNMSPSNEHPGLISFRMDWLDLLARDSQESFPAPLLKSIILSLSSLPPTPRLSHTSRLSRSTGLNSLC